jgi:hypothetical protein
VLAFATNPQEPSENGLSTKRLKQSREKRPCATIIP